MRRGELYSYVRPATPTVPRTVVVLSSDTVHDSGRDWLLGVELRDQDPDDILGIPIGDGRFAYAGDLTRLYPAWVGERRGILDAVTVDRIDWTLRAALEL